MLGFPIVRHCRQRRQQSRSGRRNPDARERLLPLSFYLGFSGLLRRWGLSARTPVTNSTIAAAAFSGRRRNPSRAGLVTSTFHGPLPADGDSLTWAEARTRGAGHHRWPYCLPQCPALHAQDLPGCRAARTSGRFPAGTPGHRRTSARRTGNEEDPRLSGTNGCGPDQWSRAAAFGGPGTQATGRCAPAPQNA